MLNDDGKYRLHKAHYGRVELIPVSRLLNRDSRTYRRGISTKKHNDGGEDWCEDEEATEVEDIHHDQDSGMTNTWLEADLSRICSACAIAYAIAYGILARWDDRKALLLSDVSKMEV